MLRMFINIFTSSLRILLIDTNPISTENNLFIGTLQGKILGSSVSGEEPLLIKVK